MKEFMLIFIGAEYSTLGLSPEQMQERMGKWFSWNTKMREQGIVKNGDALHPHGRRITGENRTVTDGPFAESKEIIGGFYTVKAVDYNAAIEIAQDYPDYDLGGIVEVREVLDYGN